MSLIRSGSLGASIGAIASISAAMACRAAGPTTGRLENGRSASTSAFSRSLNGGSNAGV